MNINSPVVATAQNRVCLSRKNSDGNDGAFLFEPGKKTADMRAYHRDYYKKNTIKCRAKSQRYRKNHPDRLVAYTRKHYLENREALIKRSRDWAENNPEKLRLKGAKYHREHREAILLRFSLIPRERAWAGNALRRKKRLGFDVQFTVNDLTQIALKHDPCPYCGIDINYSPGGLRPNSPSLDRIENGKGVLTLKDIQILCSKCNATKSNRSHAEFIDYCSALSKKYNPQIWEPGTPVKINKEVNHAD